VLYPALATAGLVTESDKLSLDQAHAMVQNAQRALLSVKDEAAWMAQLRTLQTAVLRHAQQDEEADLYPRLQQKMDPTAQRALAVAYKAQFDTVKPMSLRGMA